MSPPRQEIPNLQSPRTTLPASVFDGAHRERVVFCAAAVLLVCLRSAVPALYEGFHFDSDQATVGLMAKHLSEFRRFPLFYDGLNYLLGVEAWVIAPFFWIARPSVLAMRIPLVGLNALVAAWLIATISRRAGRVRPALAFVAALPFIVPTPVVSDRLIEANGSCVEPFVYVLLLWHLRRRPWAFGALLAVAVLHREFIVAALPALLMTEPGVRHAWSPTGRRWAGAAAAGFGLVWLGINVLRMRLSATPLGIQAASLGGQVCLVPQELAGRAVSLVTEALPTLFGAARTALAQFALDTPNTAGHPVVLGIVAAAAAGLAVRMAWRRSDLRPFDDGRRFAVYLILVGLGVSAFYPASCAVLPGAPPVLRYLLLALLIPVGACALFLQSERSGAVKAAAATACVLWAGANLVDNVSLLRAAAEHPPRNEHRVLTDYLVSRHVRYARAIYWDAYVVDFLSRERVVVASIDVVRIPEYQRRVDGQAASAVTLERLPCNGGERVASWCVQRPSPGR
jgi:hypothetical protein